MGRSPDFHKNKTISDLIAEQRKPPILPETGWYKVGLTSGYEASTPLGIYVGVTFENTWENDPSPTFADASWYLDDHGEVRMRGKVTGGAGGGEEIFTLPEEARPEFEESFIVPVDGNGNVDLSNVRFRAFADNEDDV